MLLKPVLGGMRIVALNKTESAVFLYCRFSLFLKDPFRKLLKHMIKMKLHSVYYSICLELISILKTIMGRLHDKSLKITLSLNSRLAAVDCIKSGFTSLRLKLSLDSR